MSSAAPTDHIIADGKRITTDLANGVGEDFGFFEAGLAVSIPP